MKAAAARRPGGTTGGTSETCAAPTNSGSVRRGIRLYPFIAGTSSGSEDMAVDDSLARPRLPCSTIVHIYRKEKVAVVASDFPVDRHIKVRASTTSPRAIASESLLGLPYLCIERSTFPGSVQVL
jgi:hypothetical protein